MVRIVYDFFYYLYIYTSIESNVFFREILRILKNTQKSKKLVIASMGTDGIDGNSVFAGAITENVKVDLDTMKEFLKNSDSGRFFQKQKGSIATDFTHTNLMDIGVILR